MKKRKNKIIQVVGVPCVGKDYLLNNYQKLFNSPYHIIEFGKELNELVNQEISLKVHKDDLKNMDCKIINKCIDTLLERIIQHQQPAIINSHVVLKKEKQFIWYFDFEKKVDTLAYIHLIATPEEIRQRRLEDNARKKRKRTVETVEEIAKHQKISIAKTKKIAKKVSAEFVILDNTKNQIRPNLELLHNLFRRYLED